MEVYVLSIACQLPAGGLHGSCTWWSPLAVSLLITPAALDVVRVLSMCLIVTSSSVVMQVSL